MEEVTLAKDRFLSLLPLTLPTFPLSLPSFLTLRLPILSLSLFPFFLFFTHCFISLSFPVSILLISFPLFSDFFGLLFSLVVYCLVLCPFVSFASVLIFLLVLPIVSSPSIAHIHFISLLAHSSSRLRIVLLALSLGFGL